MHLLGRAIPQINQYETQGCILILVGEGLRTGSRIQTEWSGEAYENQQIDVALPEYHVDRIALGVNQAEIRCLFTYLAGGLGPGRAEGQGQRADKQDHTQASPRTGWQPFHIHPLVGQV